MADILFVIKDFLHIFQVVWYLFST